ncbi:uncharacterized protein LOC123513545 [Portunus trituberculatus]|uniref:uncharacterized protein LOC123513545 n=1 Tax=Portunus trituberculatus TaxID=210409 RepID=UPI001E1CC41E|nr:uncharacterized protein LOC123513545 [Portunus trituberculatus]
MVVMLPAGHGGYIPFVEVPCERFLGELIQWIITTSLLPLGCPLVPWLCCPYEYEPTSITISNELSCNEAGAVYGAATFWAMKIVSLVGIILAIVAFSKCATGVVADNADTIANLTQLTSNILAGIDKQVTLQDGQFTLEVDKVVNFIEGKEKNEEKQDVKEEKEDVEEEEVGAFNETVLGRSRRQVSPGRIQIPILPSFVTGTDDASDGCQRADVLVDDECHQVLSQGPCDDDEVVLIDHYTRQGYCAPRLCPHDKVFVHEDQLCHDPLEYGLCPPGRQLFTNGFGSSVCGCPDGTYEEEDDLDDDVCEPLLGNNDCPPGQVFWFNDFRYPVGCHPDPCQGLNLKRGPNELPYIPALFDGKCYQIGKRPFFCKYDELYSMSYKQLKGVCITLEDAGYTVLDSDTLSFLDTTYGASSNTDGYRKAHKHKAKLTPASTTLLKRPEVGEAVMHADEDEEEAPRRLSIGQSAAPSRSRHDPKDNEVDDDVTPLHTHLNAFSPSYIAVGGRTFTFLNLLQGPSRPHSRQRRAPLPFVSPGNVFEPGLSACRAGAKRDANAKCRNTILPGRYPPSRAKRSVPPVPPHPACPQGTFRDITRKCTPNKSSLASSINALNLG